MFFLYLFKNKIIYNFVIFEATKKVAPQMFSPPPLMFPLLDPGYEIRDKHPESRNTGFDTGTSFDRLN